MKLHQFAYVTGVLLLSASAFLCPVWYLGFIPLGVGSLWACYDLIEVEAAGGDAPTAPQ